MFNLSPEWRRLNRNYFNGTPENSWNESYVVKHVEQSLGVFAAFLPCQANAYLEILSCFRAGMGFVCRGTRIKLPTSAIFRESLSWRLEENLQKGVWSFVCDLAWLVLLSQDKPRGMPVLCLWDLCSSVPVSTLCRLRCI